MRAVLGLTQLLKTWELILCFPNNRWSNKMNKFFIVLFSLWGISCSGLIAAGTCPDPQTTSLKWGIPPEPWRVNPFSSHDPQGEDTTRFVSAQILETGYYGQGILCTYRISIGDYSIWWPVLTKIPSRSDTHWINAPGGYVCTQSIQDCTFVTAQS
jgi:hypothetical protein